MQNSEAINNGLNSFTAACSWRSGVTQVYNTLEPCGYSVFSIEQLRYFLLDCIYS
jgi:hypothetical protein